MGYTHYLYRKDTLPKKKWKQFADELEMLAKNLPKHGITAGNEGVHNNIILCGWNDKAKEYEHGFSILSSVKGDDCVAFNGEGELGHESFYVPRIYPKADIELFGIDEETGLYFQFCKTARKPYDTMVCLALISMKRWFMADVIVASDGDIEDWQPAFDLYHKLTGVIINWDMLTYKPKTRNK